MSSRGRRVLRLTMISLITALALGTVGLKGIQAPPQLETPAQLDGPVAVSHALSGQFGAFRDKWFGSPALFSPAPIAGVEIRFFDVKGTTQRELIASLDASNLCGPNPCLPDPGAPKNGVAWAVQGGGFGTGECYSPRSASLPIQNFIQIPRWGPKPFGQVSAGLIMKWNALEQILYTHETTHAAIAARDLGAIASQARQQPSCDAWYAYLSQPSLFAQLEADQNAFHAQLRADCRPEIGCIPSGYMGW